MKSAKQSFQPVFFERKWQDIWEKEGIYQPDLEKAKKPFGKVQGKPFYNLMMFPYPSAEGLHVGNMYAFTGADIYGRFMRMKGFDVFEPIGLDGFGIHSENYAIKIGKHPKEQAKISEKNFYRQLHAIGNGFAFRNTLETYDPEYYKWTQWIFVQMFKHGLAYRKKSPLNFCPSCKTVLADEQVINGACERCKSTVVKKEMAQWFFRITAYADKLLQNTYKESFKWSEKVKVGQRNWIGKKEGINIRYQVSGTRYQVECFTTRPDTNFGVTFVVLSPEHPFVEKILSSSKLSKKLKSIITNYVEKAKKKSEIERIAEGREKTGVFTEYYCINQLNNCKMPLFISDFVLKEFGTGAVVGVPGHDKRDFEFAKKFNLPVVRVVVGKDGDKSPITRIEQVEEEEGRMVNSEFLNNLDIHKASEKIMDYMEEKGWGKRITTYKLRDWCISRQRYWGAPIPMIFCQKCAEKNTGWLSLSKIKKQEASSSNIPDSKSLIRNSDLMPGWYPVPEKELPVLLPDLSDWKPEGTGKGPLAKDDSFVKATCPECGGIAQRETDVCDTFLDSSWYFLRYPSVNIVKDDTQRLPWDPEITEKWLPVAQYIGGAEHTVLHLLYSRFVWMCFYDWGLVNPPSRNSPIVRSRDVETFSASADFSSDEAYKKIPRPLGRGSFNFSAKGGPQPKADEPLAQDPGWDEPFSRFYAHGLIISEGAKMSKSKGNIVVPDEYIKKYGADALRAYLMFLGPFDQGGDFRDAGIAGMFRFLSRVWRLVSSVVSNQWSVDSKNKPTTDNRQPTADLTRIMHKTIKEVTKDMENLRYNTAIAHIMEFVNHLTDNRQLITDSHIKSLLLMLAPFAPHMTEELWYQLSVIGNQKSEEIKPTTDNRQPTAKYTSIHLHPWPVYDPKYLVEETVMIVVQVNGKLRDTIEVRSEKREVRSEIEEISKNSEKVKKYLEGKKLRKVIFVPGRLINFVTL